MLAANFFALSQRKTHGVWKSQKKSHSTLRAKRATFTFWVDKSKLKMPKTIHFGEFLKTWSLRSNSVTRQVSLNRTKIVGKCQNSNGTFWVIFKQCKDAKKNPLKMKNKYFAEQKSLWKLLSLRLTFTLRRRRYNFRA